MRSVAMALLILGSSCQASSSTVGNASPTPRGTPSSAAPASSPTQTALAPGPTAAAGGVEVFATGPLHGNYVWVVRSETVLQEPVTDSLYAVPVDGGSPKLVLRRVRDRGAPVVGLYTTGAIVPSRQLSADGTKLAIEQSVLGPAAHDGFIVVDLLKGTITELLRGDRQPDVMPAWSPDGKRIAFARRSAAPGAVDDGLWVVNADGTGLRRILPGACCAQATVLYGWTADGTGIAFAVTFEGADYSIVNAATGDVTGPHGQAFGFAPASWRLKGPQFAGAFSAGDKGGEQRIDVADRIGAPARTIWHEPSDVATGDPFLLNARWSPVADEILYVRSGREQKVMRLSLTGDPPTEVPVAGGPFRAEWLPDGRIVVITAQNGIGGVVHVMDGATQTQLLSFPTTGASLVDLGVRSYP